MVQEDTSSLGKGSPVAVPATSNGHSAAPQQQFSASQPFSNSAAEPFANFADFDTAAFDSLPAGKIYQVHNN